MIILSLITLCITFVINKSISATDSSPTTVIIDVDKGIALNRIGVYYEKLEESIFHIFIPFNNYCIDSPSSDVCEYIQPTKPNIVEVGTIMSYFDHIPILYNTENISTLLLQDLQRVFSNHRINKFMEKSKSIVFYIDDNFYVTHNTIQTSTTSSISSLEIIKRAHVNRATNSAMLVLEQVFNNKVGYDFLSDEHISELVSLFASTSDIVLDAQYMKENIDIFVNMIIGQSVHALKSCLINDNDQLRKAPPCLVVSTIFRRIPSGTSSVYQVYSLMPLPVVFNGEKYVYSDLPNIFGLNSIDKKVVIWNDNDLTLSCIFSKIVHCRNDPVSIPVSSVVCLNELFSSESTALLNCQVTKSKDNQVNILNIKNNIWYFYSNNQSANCELQSTSSPLMDSVSIKEPTIITLPCGRSVQCSNVRLPQSTCVNNTVILKSKHNNTINTQSVSTISFANITNRLVSIYKTGATKALIDLQKEIDYDKTFVDKFPEQFASLLISIVAFIAFVIKALLDKAIKRKNRKKLQKLQTDVNRIQRDFIDDV